MAQNFLRCSVGKALWYLYVRYLLLALIVCIEVKKREDGRVVFVMDFSVLLCL